MSSINVIYLITEMSVENEQKDFCLKKKKKKVFVLTVIWHIL